jgi:hypothetical protein
MPAFHNWFCSNWDGRTTSENALLRAAVVQYQLTPVVLDGDASAAVEQLVRSYMDNRIFSEKMREDAIHVAICTTLAFDALASWNFRHLANVHQQLRIAAVNAHMGYRKKLNLITPLELMDESTHQ